MRIMVLGSDGFLGKHVCAELEKTHRIIRADLPVIDITNSSELRTYVDKSDPEVIVHLAALTGARTSMIGPLDFSNVNINGTINILEICRTVGIKKFVYMSSLTVHGKVGDNVDESWPINPAHVYGATKAAGEALVRAYSNAYNINSISFRPNLITGPGKAEDDIIYDFIRSAKANISLKVFGDGLHKRQWTHPHDIARAIMCGIENIETLDGTYCLGSNSMTVLELANEVTKMAGIGNLEYIKPSEQSFNLSCSSKLFEEKSGWKARISISQIIKEVWDDIN